MSDDLKARTLSSLKELLAFAESEFLGFNEKVGDEHAEAETVFGTIYRGRTLIAELEAS